MGTVDRYFTWEAPFSPSILILVLPTASRASMAREKKIHINTEGTQIAPKPNTSVCFATFSIEVSRLFFFLSFTNTNSVLLEIEFALQFEGPNAISA